MCLCCWGIHRDVSCAADRLAADLARGRVVFFLGRFGFRRRLGSGFLGGLRGFRLALGLCSFSGFLFRCQFGCAFDLGFAVGLLAGGGVAGNCVQCEAALADEFGDFTGRVADLDRLLTFTRKRDHRLIVGGGRKRRETQRGGENGSNSHASGPPVQPINGTTVNPGPRAHVAIIRDSRHNGGGGNGT